MMTKPLTATEQFIKDAIEGGYKPVFDDDREKIEDWMRVHKHEVLLDPNAWRAVGKTRGWTHFGDCQYHPVGNLCQVCNMGDWKDYWHRFIDALADEKDIETALAELT